MDLSEALETVTRSDIGMVRAHNEDAVYASSASGIAILADGMGGNNAGEVASAMVTNMLGTELENSLAQQEPHYVDNDGRLHAHRTLELGIGNANSAVYQAAQNQPQYAGMGTTLVAAWFYDNSMTVAHIGDSRLYRLRGTEFQLITRDHSLLQEQLDCGTLTEDQARNWRHRNLVTRALGVDMTVEPEINDYETLPGDIYLLCSDGLNDMAEDHEIGATLYHHAADLELAATQLTSLANNRGGRDNVSVILVRIKRSYAARRSGVARLMNWFKSPGMERGNDQR